LGATTLLSAAGVELFRWAWAKTEEAPSSEASRAVVVKRFSVTWEGYL